MVKIYRNEDVEEIIAAVPNGHYHVRFLIRFKDQEILLQEATVAAIVRAYALTALHPVRRGIVLRRKILSKDKKKGFASAQLIEEYGSEDEAISYITRIMGESVS
jgi:predicted hydrolase (HD superfamily)